MKSKKRRAPASNIKKISIAKAEARDEGPRLLPLRPAVQEMIDAAMEKRPFDWHRLPDPINVGPGDSMTNCGMGQQLFRRIGFRAGR